MFSVFTPITYNTNLNSILGHYYFGFCGGNCAPYASLFNGFPHYSNIFMTNLCPTMCPDSFNIGFGQNYNSPTWNTFSGGISNQMTYNTIMPSTGTYQQFSTQETTTQAKQNQAKFVAAITKPARSTSPSTATNKTTKTVTNPAKSTTQVTPSQTHTKTTATAKPAQTQTQTQTQTTSTPKTNLGKEFVTTANKYNGLTEASGKHHKFCVNPTCKYDDPFDQEWCTDFVTYVVKETYKNNGMTPPDGFGNHDVETLKNWAINNGYFIRTSDKARKGNYMAQNIKPGDIMIMNENGSSHTGFVTKVDKDGTLHTIEGNRDDMVRTYSYSPNYPDISGFIRLNS